MLARPLIDQNGKFDNPWSTWEVTNHPTFNSMHDLWLLSACLWFQCKTSLDKEACMNGSCPHGSRRDLAELHSAEAQHAFYIQEKGFLDVMQWFIIRNKGKAVASLEGIKHPTPQQWAKAFPVHKPDLALVKSHPGQA